MGGGDTGDAGDTGGNVGGSTGSNGGGGQGVMVVVGGEDAEVCQIGLQAEVEGTGSDRWLHASTKHGETKAPPLLNSKPRNLER